MGGRKKDEVFYESEEEGGRGEAEGHIRMLRGSPVERKVSANDRTDLMEQRSSFRTSTLAEPLDFKILSLEAFPASVFLAAMMTWAPLRAKTLAVSSPIPLAPPLDTRIRIVRERKKNRGRELTSDNGCE